MRQITRSINVDYSDAVQALQLQFMPATSSTLAMRVPETGAQHPFRRVFLRLLFVNDASVRLFSRVG